MFPILGRKAELSGGCHVIFIDHRKADFNMTTIFLLSINISSSKHSGWFGTYKGNLITGITEFIGNIKIPRKDLDSFRIFTQHTFYCRGAMSITFTSVSGPRLNFMT